MLPTDAKKRKAVPLWRGTFGYFPDALAGVAELSFIGNEQHNPGEPMHWAREKSTDHEDCILRHMLDAEDSEPDADGVLHEVKVAWRALAKAQLAIEKRRAAVEAPPVTARGGGGGAFVLPGPRVGGGGNAPGKLVPGWLP